MTQEQLPTFLAIISPQVLSLLMNDKDISEQEAMQIFYNSELYATLEQEESKLWHLSANALYTLLAEELLTGKITYYDEL